MRCVFSVVSVIAGCTSAQGDVGASAGVHASGDSTPATAPSVARTAPIETPLIGDAANPGRVAAVYIVATHGDSTKPEAIEPPVFAKLGEPVMLYAVLEVVRDGHTTLYSDAPLRRLGHRSVTALPIARAPRVELRWNRLEPANVSLSNGNGDHFHFEPIDYRATPIARAGGRPAIPPDVHPTLTPDHGHGVGTMRFQLVVLQGDRVIASPGPEARRGKGSGGLTDAVARVSIRRDDTYLGVLTEMYNQPYIWGSAGLSEMTHQSERLEGADCADFIVYGVRRMGRHIPYTYTGELPKFTKLVAAGKRGNDGIYRDRDGKPIAFPRPGDILLFPRHVGAVFADRGTIGVLDDQDVMMHTLFDSPKEQAIADSGYAGDPVEVRRFDLPKTLRD